MSGRLYSVGKEIISMDWVELSLTVLSKTRDSALAEVIMIMIIIMIIMTIIITIIIIIILRAVLVSVSAVTRTRGRAVTWASSSSLATFTASQRTGDHHNHYYCH